MPRFFFLIADGDVYEDEEGQQYADGDAAMVAALTAARELMAEDVKNGHISLRDRIVVSDEEGQVVGTLNFKDALKIDE